MICCLVGVCGVLLVVCVVLCVVVICLCSVVWLSLLFSVYGSVL